MKAVSSSSSACIRVSGTYFPPNFPNRPNESGRCRIAAGSTSSLTIVGCLVSVQRTEGERELGEEGGVNLLNLKGKRGREGECGGRYVWAEQAGDDEAAEKAMFGGDILNKISGVYFSGNCVPRFKYTDGTFRLR